SSSYDGHFRRISVSLKDSKLIVQSRAGYYAIPDLNGQSVTLPELAALHALDRKDQRPEFPFRVAAFRFHPEAQGFGYEVAFDVATANLTTPITPDKTSARVSVIFFALLKDMAGQIVGRSVTSSTVRCPWRNSITSGGVKLWLPWGRKYRWDAMCWRRRWWILRESAPAPNGFP
ncbi:MAG TPA: hypothetical protein VH351_10690, partial [Bryobacteraceae bacterium]|nr:hypothetical protein [Bryobacteraceae bacterium]